MQVNQKSILWLASWYPSKLDRYTGDFIQRHARALAMFTPLHVIFVVRDKQRKITDSIKIEETVDGNLRETIIYYTSPDYSPAILDRFFSIRNYEKVFKDYIKSKNIRPDIVHVHVPYRAGIFGRWIRENYSVSYFLTEHWAGYERSNPDNYWSRSLSFRFLIRRIFTDAACIVPVSKDLEEKLKKNFPIKKSVIVPNTVNEKLFYKSIPESDFSFVHYASPVIGHKNTEGLLNVLLKLKAIRSDWRCIIYGNAGDHLLQFVNHHGLDRQVHFTGEISYEEVATIVRKSSVFISFSNYENQPCSILEALCCGLPVIATAIGGIPEIINQKNGILIQPQNEDSLYEAVVKVLDNKVFFDKDIIAQEATEKYSYASVGKQFLSLYTNYQI